MSLGAKTAEKRRQNGQLEMLKLVCSSELIHLSLRNEAAGGAPLRGAGQIGLIGESEILLRSSQGTWFHFPKNMKCNWETELTVQLSGVPAHHLPSLACQL